MEQKVHKSARQNKSQTKISSSHSLPIFRGSHVFHIDVHLNIIVNLFIASAMDRETSHILVHTIHKRTHIFYIVNHCALALCELCINLDQLLYELLSLCTVLIFSKIYLHPIVVVVIIMYDAFHAI